MDPQNSRKMELEESRLINRSLVGARFLTLNNQVDSKLPRNLKLINIRFKPPQNVVHSYVEYEASTKFLEGTLLANSNYQLISYCKFLQSFVKICCWLIASICQQMLACKPCKYCSNDTAWTLGRPPMGKGRSIVLLGFK